MPEEDERIHELFDVNVTSVGLVRKGANKRPWYLLKADEEGKMSEERDVLEVLNQLEQVEEGELTRSHWDNLVGVVKSWFAREGDPEPEPGPVEKSEMELRVEALEKAHRDQIAKMQAEIEQVRKEAAQKVQKAEERVSAIEKAKRMAEIEPIAKGAGLEAEVLYNLEKSDLEAYEAITERFQAFQAQLEEAGLWKEHGSSQPGEQDAAKRIMARAAEIKKSQPEVSMDVAITTAAAEVEGYEEYRQRVITEGK